MDVQAVLSQTRDAITVKRVFGDPIERNGITVIPVAKVGGGGGGGGSKDGDGGVGFGVRASPAGVYVIKDDTARWEPALDLNRVILGGQLVAVALFLVIRSILRSRSSD